MHTFRAHLLTWQIAMTAWLKSAQEAHKIYIYVIRVRRYVCLEEKEKLGLSYPQKKENSKTPPERKTV